MEEIEREAIYLCEIEVKNKRESEREASKSENEDERYSMDKNKYE